MEQQFKEYIYVQYIKPKLHLCVSVFKELNIPLLVTGIKRKVNSRKNIIFSRYLGRLCFPGIWGKNVIQLKVISMNKQQ